MKVWVWLVYWELERRKELSGWKELGASDGDECVKSTEADAYASTALDIICCVNQGHMLSRAGRWCAAVLAIPPNLEKLNFGDEARYQASTGYELCRMGVSLCAAWDAQRAMAWNGYLRAWKTPWASYYDTKEILTATERG